MGAFDLGKMKLVAASMIFAARLSLAADPNASNAESSTAKPGARVLFVTQSFEFKHDVVKRKESQKSVAERTMEELGVSSNVFRCDSTQDVAKDLTKENLQNYDILMFYTTGHRAKWPVDDATLDYIFKDWVKQKGHGFVGVHSAADTLEDYEPYWEMLGGSFDAHPWTANSQVTVVVDDPQHPIAKPWGKEFQIKDEIYQFKHWQPEKVRVLMSLDIGRSEFNKQVRDNVRQFHVPIAWCKQYGDGRVFHMSLGHNEAVWLEPRYRESLLGGIKWILGLEPGDATPNSEIEAPLVEKGKKDFAIKNDAFIAESLKQAQSQVDRISQTCLLYNQDMNHFPMQLADLRHKPDVANRNQWAGPYVDRDIPADPWGHPYQYQFPGTRHGKDKPDVWSWGPDGKNGTDDDIYNR